MRKEEIKVGISMDGADEVAEKIDSISTALDDMSPMVSIRGCRDCTFNIHPRRTVFVSKDDKKNDKYKPGVDGFNSCDECKYCHANPIEEPCVKCKHNHMDYFRRKTNE